MEAAGVVPAASGLGSPQRVEIVREIEAGLRTEGAANSKTGANGLNHRVSRRVQASNDILWISSADAEPRLTGGEVEPHFDGISNFDCRDL